MVDGRQTTGRLKKTWSRTVQEDQAIANITLEEAEHTAMDHHLLHQPAAQSAYWYTRN